MTVSIVIPCFNYASYLGEAIESAFAQTWRDLEVIVVDDGSTDESAAVARRYPRVLLVSQPNRGLARARNAGLHASRGQILIFLDADDRLTPIAAEAAAEALTRLPGAMMAYGRCHLIDERGEPMRTALREVRTHQYEEMLRSNFLWMPAMAAYRRAAFLHVGEFDTRVNASADYDMYLRVMRTLPVIGHDAVVAEYRQHGANMSGDPRLMLETTLTVMRAQRPFVRGNRRLMAAYRDGMREWREFYGDRLVERFRAAWHAHHWKAASAHARDLLRFHPRGVGRQIARKVTVTARRLRRRTPEAPTTNQVV